MHRYKMHVYVQVKLADSFYISAVKSFVELVKYLFTVPGVSSFLSGKINQDPLEKFFGRQRQRGRVNENPSVSEFVKNTQSLRVIGNVCGDTIKGNCRGQSKNPGVIMIGKENSEPLNKRPRRSCH